jgi:hypothetical protein
MAGLNYNESEQPYWFPTFTDADTYGPRATTIDVEMYVAESYGLGTWDWQMYVQHWNGTAWKTQTTQYFSGYVSPSSPSFRSFNISKVCPTSGSYRVIVFLHPRPDTDTVINVTHAFVVNRE